MRAETLSRKPGYVGAVAFSRSGDPAAGDFGDAKVVRKIRPCARRSERTMKLRQQRDRAAARAHTDAGARDPDATAHRHFDGCRGAAARA